MVRMVTREEGLPEELLALMEDMKNAQKRANQDNGKESLSLLTQWVWSALALFDNKLIFLPNVMYTL